MQFLLEELGGNRSLDRFGAEFANIFLTFIVRHSALAADTVPAIVEIISPWLELNIEEVAGLAHVLSGLIQTKLLPPELFENTLATAHKILESSGGEDDGYIVCALEVLLSMLVHVDDAPAFCQATFGAHQGLLEKWVELIDDGYFSTIYLRLLAISGLRRFQYSEANLAPVVQRLIQNALLEFPLELKDQFRLPVEMPAERVRGELPGFVMGVPE
jgi:hypothetical protein